MWTLLTQKGSMNYDKWKMSSFGHYVYKNYDPHAKVIARASFACSLLPSSMSCISVFVSKLRNCLEEFVCLHICFDYRAFQIIYMFTSEENVSNIVF